MPGEAGRRLSEAARAYRVLPCVPRDQIEGRGKPFEVDENALQPWYDFGPDAVRAAITRQLVDEFGRRATTPGEHRLLIRWVRYRVADEMAERYPVRNSLSA